MKRFFLVYILSVHLLMRPFFVCVWKEFLPKHILNERKLTDCMKIVGNLWQFFLMKIWSVQNKEVVKNILFIFIDWTNLPPFSSRIVLKIIPLDKFICLTNSSKSCCWAFPDCWTTIYLSADNQKEWRNISVISIFLSLTDEYLSFLTF